MYPLHTAALSGSLKKMVALLARGTLDINQGDANGTTPLAYASVKGHSGMVRILLNKGASVSAADSRGYIALHAAAQGGQAIICKMLLEAGADLEATSAENLTPLFLAALLGHSKALGVLIEAGANTNSRSSNGGATPLYNAAEKGHVVVTKMLLRAKANPLLAARVMGKTMAGHGTTRMETVLPLDAAAQNGHSAVIRELIQQVKIKGCGGESGGVDSLVKASMMGHLDVMAALLDAGVIDDGRALAETAKHRRESSAKLLLRQERKISGQDRCANYQHLKSMAVIYAVGFGGVSPSLRIVRLLVDAGAETTITASISSSGGRALLDSETPLALATRMLRDKNVGGEGATEEQLHRLEGICRLLSRVKAVHAVSWLWPSEPPSDERALENTSKTKATSNSLRMLLPVLRRRARRPRVLLSALFRWVVL